MSESIGVIQVSNERSKERFQVVVMVEMVVGFSIHNKSETTGFAVGLAVGCGKRGIRIILRFWLLLNDCSHLLNSEVRGKGKILGKESECPLALIYL